MFPIEYGKYIEPFGGSGAVLLGKPKPDKFEVYNDYNHNLVNLFRCMRDRPMGLIKELGFCNLNSRLDYKDLSDFFKKETFDDTYIEEEIELTKTMLPMPYAEEIIELYTKSRKDYDLRSAAMFLKSLRYSYARVFSLMGASLKKSVCLMLTVILVSYIHSKTHMLK